MNIRHIFIIAAAALLTMEAFAGPARNMSAIYTQPDGSTFTATIIGDEWMKIRKTSDGCAIIKDIDGWWCYGIYENDGTLTSSGFRIMGQTPAHIIAASRRIPYESIAERAAARRRIVQENAVIASESTKKAVAQTRVSDLKIRKRGIAILAQFQDVKFQYTKEDFARMLNAPGYNGTGSAKEYYEAQFGEGWEFNFDVSDIVTLPNNLRYYGENDVDGNDIRPAEMVRDACRLADAGVNFSLYDQDGDMQVDNVYVFYAGIDEASHSDQTHLIWAHQYYVYLGSEKLDIVCDGVRIDRYACSSEFDQYETMTGIGPFCHEFGHTLGLMDLYDTDYDLAGGWAAGLWKSTSLMDGGNYNNRSDTPPNFNCIEREMLGLSSPVMLEAGKSYNLEPIEINGTYYRLDTDTQGEYFLFECRSDKGWDRYIGGKGLLVYHIDRNAYNKTSDGKQISKWASNTINNDCSHQCADLLEADGRSDQINSAEDFMQGLGGIFFPQADVSSLTDKGHPSLTFWNGNTSDISLTGIRAEGDNILFSVIESSDVPVVPSVANAAFTTYPDAATISFESSNPSLEGKAVIKWRKSGSNDEYATVYPEEYETGKYICRLEKLESGNISYEALVRFEGQQAIGKATRLSFMTKRKPEVAWPYLHLPSGADIQYGSGIELYVVNAASAAEISWTFDGEPVTFRKDLKFYPEADGTLKVEIFRNDGSRDIIVKRLNIIRL